MKENKTNDINRYLTFISGTLHSYQEYGIEIPMMNSRVTKTLESIEKEFGHIRPLKITQYEKAKELISLAHSKEYLSELERDPKSVVLKTYELINEYGQYVRYNPKNASKPLEDFITKAYLHVLGSYESCLKALENDFCYHLGGGMHHAMSDSPGGFCMFNDIVSSIRMLQRNKRIQNAAVIDMDAHKGDGTAEITEGDISIRTYSIHMKNGWPLDGTSPRSEICSDCDVGINLEDDYISIHQSSLSRFLEESDIDFAFVIHGGDVYKDDSLESSSGIQLNLLECLQRDQLTFEMLRERNIPQSWAMAGGYGEKSHKVFTQFLKYALERNTNIDSMN